MSLRKRLVLTMGGPVLACIVCAVVAVLVTSGQQARLQTGHRAQELVDRAQVTVEAELSRMETLARLVSQDPLVRSSIPASVNTDIHWTAVEFGDYLEGSEFLEVRDYSGNVVYSSMGSEGVWAVPGRTGLHVMRPVSDSGLSWAQDAGLPVVVGVAPITDASGNRHGTVVAGCPMTRALLTRIAAHTGYPVAVWGADGTPIALSQPGPLPHMSSILHSSDFTQLATGGVVLERTGRLGEDSLACFWSATPNSPAAPPAYMAVVAPAVLASTNWPAMVSVCAIALACVLFTFLITLRVGNRLAGDVSRLARFTRDIGLGRLDARVETQELLEMGDLGRALNSMAVRVEEAQEELSGSEERLLKATIETRRAYEDALGSLATALDARDNETREHSYRVMEFALRIAREMDLDPEEMVFVERGALLHDIGKIGIPDSILLKPNQLSADEWAVMKEHPRIGFTMLASVEFLAKAAEIVYAHHERWDGEGYPRGLKGEQIPVGARIFAVVDAFDAITSDRPYRKALSYDAARAALIRDCGAQFAPPVVDAFCRVDEEEWEELRRQIREYVDVSRERAARKVVDFDVSTTREDSSKEPTKDIDILGDWRISAG